MLLDTPVSEARTFEGVGEEDSVSEAVKEAPGVPLILLVVDGSWVSLGVVDREPVGLLEA